MTETADKAPPTLRPPEINLVPVTKWNHSHSWPSVAGLRWLIFNAKTNGFASVIKRAGGRVLIDEAAFFKWVETQNESTQVV